MTCDQAAQIHAYYDGDLADAERASVEAHLGSCRECHELLEELKGLTQMLSTAELAEPPMSAMNRMQGAFWAAAQVRDRAVRRMAGWLTAAAAAVLVFVPLYSPSRVVDAEQSTTAWQETIAFIPPAGPGDDANAELVQVAQWLANDLSVDQAQ